MVYLPSDSYARYQTSSLFSRDEGNVLPRSDDECWATPLDWYLLISAFLLLSITWWAHELPTIWSHGFVVFMRRTAWHALRVHVPSAQGLFALSRSRDPALWPRLYYYGSECDTWEAPEPLTPWQWVGVLVPDTLVAVGTCLGTYRFGAIGLMSYGRGPNLHLWLLPQLPTALVGYCLLAAAYLRIRNRLYVISLMYSVLLLVGVAFALAIYFPLRRSGEEEAAEAIEIQMVLIGAQYGIMILPWTLLSCCCPVLLYFLYVAVCMLARILTVGMDMEMDTNLTVHYFPFCQVSGESFGYAFITFGVFAWFLGSFGAISCHQHKEALGDLLWGWRQEERSAPGTFVVLEENVGSGHTTTVCVIDIPSLPEKWKLICVQMI